MLENPRAVQSWSRTNRRKNSMVSSEANEVPSRPKFYKKFDFRQATALRVPNPLTWDEDTRSTTTPTGFFK